MKQTLLGFMAAILLIALTAATTVSVMTVKPAQPKHTVIVSGWSTRELNNNMSSYLKAGYIVKNMAAGDGARVVVMEKY